MEEHLKPRHTYKQDGPFTRARVTVYGRTELDAMERAREARTAFAGALPPDVNCWPPSYDGFDLDSRRHVATFLVGFGTLNNEAVREQIDGLVAKL